MFLHVSQNSVISEFGELHITNSGSLQYHSGLLLGPDPPIVLGTRVLEKLFIPIFDNDHLRMGLFLKQKTFGGKEKIQEFCIDKKLKSAKCVRGLRYHEPWNSCVRPDCGAYFFQTYDHYTQQCVLRFEGWFFWVFIAVVVGLIEFGIQGLYQIFHARLAMHKSLIARVEEQQKREFEQLERER